MSRTRIQNTNRSTLTSWRTASPDTFLLTTYPNLDWIALSLIIADAAARIRAAHRLRTPDAVQAATAVQSEATGLITNDSAFERVKEFETLVLEHLL